MPGTHGLEPFLEEVDVQELHSLSQDLGSDASTAVR